MLRSVGPVRVTPRDDLVDGADPKMQTAQYAESWRQAYARAEAGSRGRLVGDSLRPGDAHLLQLFDLVVGARWKL